MAYSNVWSNVIPAGTAAANTLDDQIRQLRLDIQERMNDVVADWTVDPVVLKAREACRVYHTAVQSSALQPGAVLAFDSETEDTSAMHDPVTNNSRITIVKAGRYAFGSSQIVLKDGTAGRLELRVRKNGADLLPRIQLYIPASNIGYLNVVDIRTFALNDYIEVQFASLSGEGSGTTVGGEDSSYFWASLV